MDLTYVGSHCGCLPCRAGHPSRHVLRRTLFHDVERGTGRRMFRDDVDSLRQLVQDIFVGNPYRSGGLR